MRLPNFWFDLPSALVGLLFFAGAWYAGIGPGAFVLLLLGAAYFWMSDKLGATYRRQHALRRRQAAAVSNRERADTRR